MPNSRHMDDTKTRNIWVTKYALSSGIFEAEAEIVDDTMAVVRQYKGGLDIYLHRNEWHTNQADALFDARTRRSRKIASLHKQIRKLENMDFTKP